MPQLADMYHCTGCSACVNICTRGAILLNDNREGFLTPQIDATKCVECGLCEKHCPEQTSIEIKVKTQKAFAVISNEDRRTSSSGGAFSVFAKYVLRHGGVVYGASFYERNIDGTYNNCFPRIQHVMIDNEDKLDLLRGTKYIQSYIGFSYQETFEYLRQGKFVLYTGTPCQIAGLYSFLRKKIYDGKLITLDLVCHGVPSQRLFNSYLQKVEKSFHLSEKNKNIEGFRFRNLDSWSIVPAVKIEGEKWRMLEQEYNVYINAFFKQCIFRESCYKCQYSNMNRVGTFTLADYWGIGKAGIPFKKNVSAGVSLVIDNQGQMDTMIEALREMAYIEERPLEEGRTHNHNLNEPSHRPDERDTAVMDLLDDNMTLLQYAQKYNIKDSKLKYYIRHILKEIVYSLGLYNTYKSISYRLGKGS